MIRDNGLLFGPPSMSNQQASSTWCMCREAKTRKTKHTL